MSCDSYSFPPMAKPLIRRRFTEQEKLDFMLRTAGIADHKKAAKALGVHPNTLASWFNDRALLKKHRAMLKSNDPSLKPSDIGFEWVNAHPNNEADPQTLAISDADMLEPFFRRYVEGIVRSVLTQMVK